MVLGKRTPGPGGKRKWNDPSGKAVQAPSLPRPLRAPLPSLKRQARSLTASATICVVEKSAGLTAGTPPSSAGESSQTAALPSPRGCDTSISRYGSTVGSAGLQLNVLVPIGEPVPPGRPSTTSEKP